MSKLPRLTKKQKRSAISNDILWALVQLEGIDSQLENMLGVRKDDMSETQLKAVIHASSRLHNVITCLRAVAT